MVDKTSTGIYLEGIGWQSVPHPNKPGWQLLRPEYAFEVPLFVDSIEWGVVFENARIGKHYFGIAIHQPGREKWERFRLEWKGGTWAKQYDIFNRLIDKYRLHLEYEGDGFLTVPLIRVNPGRSDVHIP